ncbi:50S ribosomal protein L21 [Candidatus Parcubacteria bacterium]|nr:50S ribosomal protein L21 [Patescibacteria group bacterium]MCG2694378.1 50S ribosomal protein L21 [Candidatus Parcubacteria bacterium]
MLAIIKTGGKQYLVKEGDKIKVEKLEGEVDDKIILTDVLMVDEKMGSPLVEGAKVEVKILKQGKRKKIRVVKYKPKTRYKKETGHKQLFTEIEIEKISA